MVIQIILPALHSRPQLRYPQIKDTGIYECQISTTPPRGYPVFLSVVGKLKLTNFQVEAYGGRVKW